MEIRQYLLLLRKWAWLLIMGLVLGGLASYLFSKNQTEIYEANTKIMISQSTDYSGVYSYNYMDERLITTYAQVIKSENDARKALLKNNAEVMYDKVGRAYGILQNAHVITSRETIDLLSTLRMGVDMQLVNNVDRHALNELFILTQPAHLQKITGKELDASARDSERGRLIRMKLQQN